MDYKPPSIKVDKPWGRFEQYTHNLPCTVKVITVAPGGVLSRQYHYQRDELWVVLDPGACVELDEKVLHPEQEEKLFIPRETIHRLSAEGETRSTNTGNFFRRVRRERHRPLGGCLRSHRTVI